MTRGDSPEFRFGGLRGDAIEETSPFPSPRAQVLAQDRRLRVVRNLLDPNRLMPAPEAQFTPTSRAKVPHPLGFSARRHQIALPPISNGFTGVVRMCPDFRPRTVRMRDPRTLRPRLVTNATRGLNTCLVSQSGFWYRTITASTGRGHCYLFDHLIRPACSPGLRRGGWTRRRSAGWPGRLWNWWRRGSLPARPVLQALTPPTVPHGITSSARRRNDDGMVRPRALAVLRLITSSNFVGCSIGRSTGLAPLGILSTHPEPPPCRARRAC